MLGMARFSREETKKHMDMGVTYQSDRKDLADGVEYLHGGAKLVS